MKRIIDLTLACVGLAIFSPVLLLAAVAIWVQDFKNPFYVAPRIGIHEKPFQMVKLRSMVVDADRTGVASTSSSDTRITKIGGFIRKFKLDEITQLWNVLIGEMSLVGPRPNVASETQFYSQTEMRLLSIKPGITDFASIVFADEGEILNGHRDADLAYKQLIWPGKSRLGLFYVQHQTSKVDLALISLTAASLFSRRLALKYTAKLLVSLNAPKELVTLSERKLPLSRMSINGGHTG